MQMHKKHPFRDFGLIFLYEKSGVGGFLCKGSKYVFFMFSVHAACVSKSELVRDGDFAFRHNIFIFVCGGWIGSKV